jgi:hypothetical protein
MADATVSNGTSKGITEVASKIWCSATQKINRLETLSDG